MSESKDYVSKTLENGTIQISADVVVSIATAAIREVEGVYGIGGRSSDFSRLTKKGVSRGIRVVISDENRVSIDCYVVVLYGYPVLQVAKSVQEAVISAVESTTGQTVRGVNVSISGITLPRSTKK